MELITDEEMDRIVNKEIAFVSDQLFINAQKICTYNYEKWGADLVSHTVMYFLNQPIQKKYSIVLGTFVTNL